MERVMGIEPTTSAWKAEVLPLNYTRIYCFLNGREDRIRTCDPLVPNQVLYQAELLPGLEQDVLTSMFVTGRDGS